MVTGASGLVGSHLVRHLVERGYTRVSALVRKGSDLRLLKPVLPQIELVYGDLLDVPDLEDALRGREWVFHCAAMISHHPKLRQQMERVNVEGTANVVNIALDYGVARFVHVSSTAALGRRKNLRSINERTEWEPSSWNSHYAKAKYRAELEVWRGVAEGLPALIANPSVVIGPGHWDRGAQKWFTNARRGMKFYPPGANGFVGANDLARFLLLLAQDERSGERYVVSAENRAYRDIFNEISDALNVARPSLAVTPIIKSAAWRWEWFKSTLTAGLPLVTRETANNSMRKFWYENTRSVEEFNFAYTPINDVIRETAQAFLTENT